MITVGPKLTDGSGPVAWLYFLILERKTPILAALMERASPADAYPNCEPGPLAGTALIPEPHWSVDCSSFSAVA